MDQTLQLPSHFYWIAGFLLVTNLGSIGGCLMVAFKAVWFLSKLDSKADAAHMRIDKIEEKKCQQ